MRHPCPRVLTATVAVVLLGLGAVGCGGGDDDSLQQAMADQFRIVVGLNDEDSYCYAGELLDYYGPDEMQRFVDNPDEFQPSTPTDQAVLLDALDNCGIDPLTLQAGRGSGAEIELERVEDPSSATTAPG